jgi:hypothetical protein
MGETTKMKNTTSENMPQTTQHRFPATEDELGKTNAIPRCTDYDLTPGEHRHVEHIDKATENVWSSEKEQTYTVMKPGNKVTNGGNF